MSSGTSTQPDLNKIRRNYEGNRPERFERMFQGFQPMRRIGVETLDCSPGDRVIDVGCGTGLSLGMIRDVVGPEGRVIGLDASADMLDRARGRIQRAGWDNVEVVEAFAHEYEPDEPLDAVFLCAVSQLICCREVIERACTWLKPGGRLVAVSMRGSGGWPGFKNQVLFRAVIPLIQREDSTRWILDKRPWAEVERVFGAVDVRLYEHDTVFVAKATNSKDSA